MNDPPPSVMPPSTIESHSDEILTLGWREWVALPDLRIMRIKAKVDTGARSSALHASNIETYQQDGQDRVRFLAHVSQKDPQKTLSVEAVLLDMRQVRSSSGKATIRPVIRTTLRLYGQSMPIDLTLAERPKMEFRMLIGREAMQRRFLVDPALSFVAGKPTKTALDKSQNRSSAS